MRRISQTRLQSCGPFSQRIQQDYEARISDLEIRLAKAEQLASGAKREATEAFDIAEQTAIDQSAGTSAANTFNPALGAVLSGLYSVDDGLRTR